MELPDGVIDVSLDGVPLGGDAASAGVELLQGLVHQGKGPPEQVCVHPDGLLVVGEDVRSDVVVVCFVLLYCAVVAYQLLAGPAVQLQLLAVLRAEQDAPLWREQLGRVFDDPGDGDYLVRAELAPQLVGLYALGTYVLPTVSAER